MSATEAVVKHPLISPLLRRLALDMAIDKQGESSRQTAWGFPESAHPMRGHNVVPWMVEAPLNSVEVIEAMLKLSRPLQVHTATHVQIGPIATSDDWDVYRGTLAKKRHCRDGRINTFQMLLEKEHRQISYVCVPADFIHDASAKKWGRFKPRQLRYISIPWTEGPQGGDSGVPGIYSPWALFYDTSYSQIRLELGDLLCSIQDVDTMFERSLLSPGTEPLPLREMDLDNGHPGPPLHPYYYKVMGPSEDDSDYVNLDDESEIDEDLSFENSEMVERPGDVYQNEDEEEDSEWTIMDD